MKVIVGWVSSLGQRQPSERLYIVLFSVLIVSSIAFSLHGTSEDLLKENLVKAEKRHTKTVESFY